MTNIYGAGTRRPSVPQPRYHLQHPRSFASSETGPRSAEARRGPRQLEARHPDGRARSYAAQSFQQLKCASAQLCCSQLAHLKDFALGAAKPPRWLSQAPTPLTFISAKQNSDGESRSRVHFVRFQWLAAPFPSRFPFSTPKSRSRAAP
jgi:hypothetical protein